MGGPGAQCWGIEELVAKTGDLICDLSTVPNGFNASQRFIKMPPPFTRTRHTKCSYRRAEPSGSWAQGNIKVRDGQQR